MNIHISPQSNTQISDRVLAELRKIVHALELNSKSLVRRVGLTGPQLVILKEIGVANDISIGDIAKKVSLSQGTVTGIIERLEKRGMVQRWKCKSDRRRVYVKTTSVGNEILNNAPPLMHESFVSQFNQLPPWTQNMILSAVQQLAAIMDATAFEKEGLEKEDQEIWI